MTTKTRQQNSTRIQEQPSIIEKSLSDGREIAGLEDILESTKRILILGCGSSWHAGLIGEYVIEQALEIPVEVKYASEFRYTNRGPILGQEDVVIGISQSGENEDTVASMQLARDTGARTLGILNQEGSSLDRIVDHKLYTGAGEEDGVSIASFTSQVLAFNQLMIQMSKHLNRTVTTELLEALEKIPDQMRDVLKQEAEVGVLANRYCLGPLGPLTNALYMGRGVNFPVALEGALKMKELSGVHAEGYPAAEMKHGPIALIDENMPSFFIATSGNGIYQKVKSNMEEVKARGGRIVAITDQEDRQLWKLADHVIQVAETPDSISPLLTAIPLQIFSHQVAMLQNDNY